MCIPKKLIEFKWIPFSFQRFSIWIFFYAREAAAAHYIHACHFHCPLDKILSNEWIEWNILQCEDFSSLSKILKWIFKLTKHQNNNDNECSSTSNYRWKKQFIIMIAIAQCVYSLFRSYAWNGHFLLLLKARKYYTCIQTLFKMTERSHTWK